MMGEIMSVNKVEYSCSLKMKFISAYSIFISGKEGSRCLSEIYSLRVTLNCKISMILLFT
jgi:hypothetical protein